MLQLNNTPKYQVVKPKGRRFLPPKLVKKYGREILEEGVAALEKKRRLAAFERATLKGGNDE